MTTEFTIWHAFAISGTLITLLLAGMSVLLGIIFNGLKREIKGAAITSAEVNRVLAELRAQLPIEYIRRAEFANLQNAVAAMRGDLAQDVGQVRIEMQKNFERVFARLDVGK